MDFFDKVKKTAASVAAVSGREAKKLYAVSKLKLEIGEKQNKVKALYKEIGHDAYKAYRNNEDVMAAIESLLGEIDSIEAEISELREKVESIKATDDLGVEDIEVDDVTAEDAEIVEEVAEPIDPIE